MCIWRAPQFCGKPQRSAMLILKLHFLAGRYGWRWRKVKRLLKVVAPATAAMLSVGLQGAGLAHLPGGFALLTMTCGRDLADA